MPDTLEKYRYPDKYTAEYTAECGESYYLDNCSVPRIPVFCDSCRETHYFVLKSIIHKSWEWDVEENSIDDTDFFGDGVIVEIETGVTDVNLS